MRYTIVHYPFWDCCRSSRILTTRPELTWLNPLSLHKWAQVTNISPMPSIVRQCLQICPAIVVLMHSLVLLCTSMSLIPRQGLGSDLLRKLYLVFIIGVHFHVLHFIFTSFQWIFHCIIYVCRCGTCTLTHALSYRSQMSKLAPSNWRGDNSTNVFSNSAKARSDLYL